MTVSGVRQDAQSICTHISLRPEAAKMATKAQSANPDKIASSKGETKSSEDDADMSDAENEKAIEFVTKIVDGQSVETARENLDSTRSNDLLSALHWTGLELFEREKMVKRILALEDAEKVTRINFEKYLEANKQHASLTKDQLKEISPEGNVAKAAIVTEEKAEVSLTVNRRGKAKLVVTGSLNKKLRPIKLS